MKRKDRLSHLTWIVLVKLAHSSSLAGSNPPSTCSHSHAQRESEAGIPSIGRQSVHGCRGVPFSLHVLSFDKVIIHGLVLALNGNHTSFTVLTPLPYMRHSRIGGQFLSANLFVSYVVVVVVFLNQEIQVISHHAMGFL